MMHSRRWTGVCLLAAALVVSGGVRGQGPGASTRGAHLIATEPMATDDNVRKAVSELAAWLATGGEAGAGWRRYLDLDALEAALLPDATVDVNRLLRLQTRLESGTPGLEAPKFEALRRALWPWFASRAGRALPALPAAARQAKGTFRPATDADVTAAKRHLRDSTAALERRLVGTVGEGWKAYLFWDLLTELGVDDAPLDVEAVDLLRNRFRAARLLWNNAALKNAAEAVEAYARVARVTTDPTAAATFSDQLETLARTLESYLAEGQEAQLEAVAAITGWLDDRGQARDLVHDIRAHLARPNLLVQVSANVLNREVQRPIQESYPIRETISGTRVVGRGELDGDLHLALVPNSAQGEFDLLLNGRTSSATTGQQPRVQISSRETTNLSGRKRVTLDAEGFHALPADVSAQTRIRYTNVAARLRIFDKVARRRVEANRAQSQRESAARTRTSIQQRLDREAGSALDQLNHTFLDDFRRPLVEHGGSSEGLSFRTAAGRLNMNSVQATAAQLGPPTAPPLRVRTPSGQPVDVWVRVHDTWIDRVSTGHLAGRTIVGAELRSALAQSVGLPKPARPGAAEDENWSITFADEQPLTVDVGDGRATVVLRGREFTTDGRPFPEMNITTPYRLEMTPQGLKLVREEPPKLYPPGFVPDSGQKLTGRQLAMRSAMTRVFEQVFEPEYLLTEIKPEGNQGRLGALRIEQCEARQGWLNIALRQISD